MGTQLFGAFTLLVVVNGQDVTVTCSSCGVIRTSIVDRSTATDAALRTHIESHIISLSETGVVHLAGWRVRKAPGED